MDRAWLAVGKPFKTISQNQLGFSGGKCISNRAARVFDSFRSSGHLKQLPGWNFVRRFTIEHKVNTTSILLRANAEAIEAASRSRAHGAPVAVAAAFVRRLISDAAVVAAIGQADDGLAAAEEEVRMTGIADRPMALLFAQLEEGAALADRDDVLERLRLGLDLRLVGSGSVSGERGGAAYRVAKTAEHGGGRARLARPRPGGRGRLGASRETEAMHLADDRVAGDPAQLGRDLARREHIRPQLLEHFDALVRPRHGALRP